MQIALIADIHGNLVSLQAVLADIASQGIDRIVCLGDVAAGPRPRGTLQALRALGCPVVLGNADEELLQPPPEPDPGAPAEIFMDIARWCARQLTAEDRAYIQSFQPALEVPLTGGEVLLAFHGTPGSTTGILKADTSESELERVVEGIDALVLAGGHTHTQMLRRFRTYLLVNPGSVGLPYEVGPGADQVRNPPWAEYAVLRQVGGGLSCDLRRVPVDPARVAGAILESGMPHAGSLAKNWA